MNTNIKLSSILLRMIFYSFFSITVANLSGSLIMTIISSQFTYEENFIYGGILEANNWYIKLVALGTSFLVMLKYFIPLYKNKNIDFYRTKILNLPLTVVFASAFSWVGAFVTIISIVLLEGFNLHISFLVSLLLGTLSVGLVSFGVSYSIQDYLNRKYLIFLVFDNTMEQYKKWSHLSIKNKFYIFFTSTTIAPFVFFIWILFWIVTQTNTLSDPQIYSLVTYGIFILIFGITLTFILSNMLHAPLIKAKYATDKIRKGEYDIELKVTSTDELGALCERINFMAETLKKDNRYTKRSYIYYGRHWGE